VKLLINYFKRRPGRSVLFLLIFFAILPLPLPFLIRLLSPHSLFSLTASVWSNDFIYWWAALAVTGYTYTTYSQKSIQREDLENSRLIAKYSAQQLEQSVTPYLEMKVHKAPSIEHLDGKFFSIRNIGNAVAREVEIEPIHLSEELTINFPIISSIPADMEWIDFSYQYFARSLGWDGINGALAWQELKEKEDGIIVKYKSINGTYKYFARFHFDDNLDGHLREEVQRRTKTFKKDLSGRVSFN